MGENQPSWESKQNQLQANQKLARSIKTPETIVKQHNIEDS